MAKEQLSAEIETITPASAKKMLERNVNNRNLSQRSLNHYIRQIEEGQWVFNGDTVRFQDNGDLMDGQHRLEAIVHTGKAQKCLVVRGLDKDAMATIDTGKGRTLADHLKLKKYNVPNFTALAAAILICYKFRNKGTYTDGKERITPMEAMAFIDQNPGILKAAEEMAANKTLIKLCTPSIAIATYYMFSKIDKWKAAEFFQKLSSGAGLGKTSPILKLKGELSERVSKFRRAGGTVQRTYLYYICMAFEVYLRGGRVEGHFPKLAADSVIELPKRGGG